MKKRIELKLFLVLNIFLLSACATSRIRERAPKPLFKPFSASFDEVWEASLRSLKGYTVPEVSRDTGTIRTEWVKTRDSRFFELIGGETILKSAQKRITIKVFRSGKFLTEVRVEKELQVYEDYFQGWENKPPDIIEPRVILYRVGRLLYLERLKQKNLQ